MPGQQIHSPSKEKKAPSLNSVSAFTADPTVSDAALLPVSLSTFLIQPVARTRSDAITNVFFKFPPIGTKKLLTLLLLIEVLLPVKIKKNGGGGKS